MEVYLVEVIEYIDKRFNNRYVSSVYSNIGSAELEKKKILKEESLIKKEDKDYDVDINVKIIPMELLD